MSDDGGSGDERMDEEMAEEYEPDEVEVKLKPWKPSVFPSMMPHYLDHDKMMEFVRKEFPCTDLDMPPSS